MTQSNGSGQLGLASWLVLVGALFASGERALAQNQIVPDNTLGKERSTVTPNVEIRGIESDRIDGGARRGANLFHSFRDFNVGEGRGAYFANPTGIENILGRVTGGNASNLLGTLGVLGDANLFLINPNGIVFGPNARLDVGGAFVGTTANAIRLANGDSFSANQGESLPNQLLNVNPSALFFNQVAARPIINRSTADGIGLQVPQDRSLLLVGGDIRLEGGRLLAPGGRVELAGIQSSEDVRLRGNGNNLELSFPEEGQRANVTLSDGALVDVRAGGGGSISINAQNLRMASESKLRAGISSGLGSSGSQAGNIEIDATGAIALSDLSFVTNSVELEAIGEGGDINIKTGSLSVVNGAELFASSNGQGDVGDINIAARNTVRFIGESPGFNSSVATSRVESDGVGQGVVLISPQGAFVSDGAFLDASTFGEGDAGNVTIEARGAVELVGLGPDGFPSGVYSQAYNGAEGNAGSISIKAGSLSVTNGAILAASIYGQGNAGTVNIDVRDRVEFKAGDELGRNYAFSGAYSRVEDEAEAQAGGDINIKAGVLSVIDGAQLSTSTNGNGNAGTITIDAQDRVEFIGLNSQGLPGGAFSRVLSGASGQEGNISVKTGSLSLIDGAVLATSTDGIGNAGNITIEARNRVEFMGGEQRGKDFPFSGVYSGVAAGAEGQAGNINITTGSLSVSDGAEISTSTRGQGSAGNITIEARDAVEFAGLGSDNSSSGAYSQAFRQMLTSSPVQNEAEGNAGSISIKAGSLSVSDGAVIATSTYGRRNAGNITIDVRNRTEFIGGDEIGRDFPFSGAYSRVQEGAEAQTGGDIDLKTGSLFVSNGAEISTSTDGIGKAGNISIDAQDAVEFTGISFLDIPSGAYSQVLTGAKGRGGSISIETGSLSVNDGAVIATSTRQRGDGNAGSIRIEARDWVELKGGDETGPIFPNSGVYSQVEPRGLGQGGNLTITTGQLTVQDGAQVSASSEGSGSAGNIKVTSRRLDLDNQGVLRAATASGKGGNISLQEQSLIIMRRESQIQTNATGTASGGNITINAPDGFIIVAPEENSDITANAVQARGGRVSIDATRIFGTEFRDRRTSLSDITATSELGPQFSGTVEIDTPEVDPSRGLVELPTAPVETEVVQACAPGDTEEQSEFIITGRGGLPPSPDEALSSDAIEVDWVSLDPANGNGNGETPSVGSRSRGVEEPSDSSPVPHPIVEAQRWVVDDNGEIWFVANAPTPTRGSSWQKSTSCHANESH